MKQKGIIPSLTGADPESFFGGGGGGFQEFRFFFCFSHHILQRREGVCINVLSGSSLVISKTPFKWRFAGGLMMAPGDGVIFQGVVSGTLATPPPL